MRRLLTLLALLACTHTTYAQGWTYLSGNASDFLDVYGTAGTAHPNNAPGLRLGSASWQLNGKLYLFGGNTYSLTGYLGLKNDLWEYDTASRNWRWIKGSQTVNAATVFGTKGLAAAGNTPGARSNCITWVHNNKLYLFGGGTDELWAFDPATGNWTWINGNDGNTKGVYGTKGIAASTNMPGARAGGMGWLYNSKLYFYGGNGYDSLNSGGLSDVWEYDPAIDTWTWIGGDKLVNTTKVPGTMGTPATANTPGYRTSANLWFHNDKLYQLGGGFGFAHSSSSDLWAFDMNTRTWTWINGSTTTSQTAVYGTMGVAAPANTPGRRLSALTWVAGTKLYLQGGTMDESTNDGIKDDLWEYDPATNQWTWIRGSRVSWQKAKYGVQGSFASDNYPGSRAWSNIWQMGNRIFMMGGCSEEPSIWGYVKTDLWEMDFATQQWRWLKGMNNQSGRDEYAMLGMEAYLNTPSARYGAQSWQIGDSVYLYGGYSIHNDMMWRYNIKTNNWAVVKGFISDTPRYSATGMSDRYNSPGKFRNSAATWTLDNKCYLFSGYGYNPWTDLWEFDPATGNWTLLKSNNKSDLPIYGTKGTAHPNNTPGTRAEAVTWTHDGKLYLFGGSGKDAAGNIGELNDLWEYNPATGNWTWLKGSNTKNQHGVYGTAGTPHANNTPGARRNTGVAQTINGKLYLFGGIGNSSLNGFPSWGYQADLWQYDPASNNWTFLKGVDYAGSVTVFGTKGIAAPANRPGGRMQGISWKLNDKLYMFGGNGFITNPSGGMLSDLWEYDPATNNWTWINGSNQYYQNGVYKNLGIADMNNTPGSRHSGSAWTSGNKLYMFGGHGYAANGIHAQSYDKNDIWYYEPCTTPAACYPNAPTVSLDSAAALCSGNTLTLNAGNAGSAFLWSTGDTTQIIGVNTPGKYWVTVTNPAGLSGADTVYVAAMAMPTVSLGNDTALCAGDTLTLDAQNTGALYYWNTGATTSTLHTAEAGNYAVNVMFSGGSCFSTDSVNVTVNPKPAKPLASADTTLCSGDTLHITGSIPASSVTRAWLSPANINIHQQDVNIPNATLADSGAYILIDSLGLCTATDTVHVAVTPSVIPSVSISANPPLGTGPWVTITFTANPANGGSAPQYRWQKNGADIPGATGNTYTATTGTQLADNDNIAVIMNSDATCAHPDTAISNTLNIPVDLSVGIFTNNTFSLYPNPNNGSFLIEGNTADNNIVFISLQNLAGQTIYTASLKPLEKKIKHTVTIPALPAGNYLLRAERNGKTQHFKFTVTR